MTGPNSRWGRTATQWVQSVLAYLDWRAGSPWRRLSDPFQRNDAERWDYLRARRLVYDAYYLEAFEPKRLRIAAPVLNAKPSPTHAELKLAGRPRAELVAELMHSGLYSDAKLLSHLARPKLAGMVARARATEHRRSA